MWLNLRPLYYSRTSFTFLHPTKISRSFLTEKQCWGCFDVFFQVEASTTVKLIHRAKLMVERFVVLVCFGLLCGSFGTWRTRVQRVRQVPGMHDTKCPKVHRFLRSKSGPRWSDNWSTTMNRTKFEQEPRPTFRPSWTIKNTTCDPGVIRKCSGGYGLRTDDHLWTIKLQFITMNYNKQMHFTHQ